MHYVCFTSASLIVQMLFKLDMPEFGYESCRVFSIQAAVRTMRPKLWLGVCAFFSEVCLKFYQSSCYLTVVNNLSTSLVLEGFCSRAFVRQRPYSLLAKASVPRGLRRSAAAEWHRGYTR